MFSKTLSRAMKFQKYDLSMNINIKENKIYRGRYQKMQIPENCNEYF